MISRERGASVERWYHPWRILQRNRDSCSIVQCQYATCLVSVRELFDDAALQRFPYPRRAAAHPPKYYGSVTMRGAVGW